MSETAYLAMLLDGPLQSWGHASRFERRTTGLHPTKSGVAGLICAALGLEKGSPEENEMLPQLAASRMTSISIPRGGGGEPAVLRLEDYHTVLGTRRASGKPNPDAVVTRREYLVDACFGVVIEAPRPVLQRVAAALADPVWGVWLGRKSCIPSEVIARGLYDTQAQAVGALAGGRPAAEFTTVTDVEDFADGTDSIHDQPLSFGDGTSSGLDTRRFGVRRIAVSPAVRRSEEDGGGLEEDV